MANSTSSTVRVVGLRELQRSLRDADPALRREVRRAGKDAADVVVPEARRLVPRRTGRLAGSIGSGTTSDGAYIKAGTAARVPYAGVIHFGWPKRRIRPQPFLFAALDARADQVIEVYEKAVDAALDAVNLAD